MTVVLDYGPAGLAPGGVDVAIECAGVAETVRQSTRLAKSGGTVVILGVMPQGEKIEIEPFDILLPDLRVLGSFLNRRAAALVASGAVEVDKLISQRVSLDEAAAVIAHAPADGEVKVLVVLGGI